MTDLPERFWQKVQRQGACWFWTACKSNGYGLFRLDGKVHRVHRLAYEHAVGEIPAGLVLDHLCRNRACVNPEHLEPATIGVNTLRSPITRASLNALKTHCPKGHEYSPENTRVYRGGRWCRACDRARHQAERYEGRRKRLVSVTSLREYAANLPSVPERAS